MTDNHHATTIQRAYDAAIETIVWNLLYYRYVDPDPSTPLSEAILLDIIKGAVVEARESIGGVDLALDALMEDYLRPERAFKDVSAKEAETIRNLTEWVFPAEISAFLKLSGTIPRIGMNTTKPPSTKAMCRTRTLVL